MNKLKVLLVDDSIVYRKIIALAIESTDVAVVGNIASNGLLAIERMENNKYDVVLLDVNMPEMGGIEALGIIKKRWANVPVIMTSGKDGKNAETTMKALEIGAMDFIVKPMENDYDKNMEFVGNYLKVLFAQISMEKVKPTNNSNEKIIEYKTIRKNSISGVDIVLIASSTGGPVALDRIFNGFGKDFNKKILIVQHMPPDFTKVLAESLDKNSYIKFIEGSDFEEIRSGQAILAPGGYHMVVEKNNGSLCIRTNTESYVNGVRPSADNLFKSVAEFCRGMRILVIVLTGMGNDGLEGVRELKKHCPCYCITQNKDSCVVYGMPRCVKEAGLSDESLDLNKISDRIQQITKYGS